MFLQRKTSTAFAIVPYRGAAPAVQDLVGFGCKVSEPRIRHVNGNVDGSKFAPNFVAFNNLGPQRDGADVLQGE